MKALFRPPINRFYSGGVKITGTGLTPSKSLLNNWMSKVIANSVERHRVFAGADLPYDAAG